MLVDGSIGFSADLGAISSSAQSSERAGFDGVWAPETGRDPFLPLLVAAEHTQTLQVGTGIAVAFARNPMTLASLANDMQQFSKGRFLLGLGSQIKAHIEKRFSMPWSHPAPRMREMIVAMRTIWDSWNNGTKLEFRGDFYTHTLMTPFFNPGPNPFGPPKVFLAAVGEQMTKVAAEVADGMLVHGFTTERYLKEVTLPAIEIGLAKSGRARNEFQLSYPAFVVTGNNEAEVQAASQFVKGQISFYGSTPAYRPVLELHGWGDLQTELNTLSKRGAWTEMAALIDDDVLNAFAVVAEPKDVADGLIQRFGDVIDRISFYAAVDVSNPSWAQTLSDLKAHQPAN